jgi:cell fate regulator YaaT (PSP1 superfamily)
MGCGSCTTRFKAGDTNASCSSGSCDINGVNKLQVFDWLANIDLPADEAISEYIEIRFKNSRKEIFVNVNGLPFFVGDIVTVDTKPGYDIGVVSLTGRLVSFQLKRKRQFKGSYEFNKVLRKASQEEINKWEEGRKLEEPTMLRTRELARTLGLVMKVSDVEYQADKSKAIFYYTADDRVDFRELIKNIADEFRVRVEMKQIGSRQEASRLGGIASCGRELCCSTWLTDFRSVSTSAARYQQLSLNPQKLTGQCGKLKCCLNYELDMYMENLKDLPKSNVVLESELGTAVHFKTDIFKKEVWYVLKGKEITSPFKLSSEQVFEIVDMNKKGTKPYSFLDLVEVDEPVKKPDYSNVVGQDDLNRFDDKKSKKKKRKSGGQWKKKQGNTQLKNQQGNKTQGKNPRNKNPQSKSSQEKDFKSKPPQAIRSNRNTQKGKSDQAQNKK